jgi:hypothetical protein
MPASLYQERLLRSSAVGIGGPDDAQCALPLAASGVQRLVWDGRYGQILIEVIGGEVRVNGDVVEPAAEALDASVPKPVRR